MSVAAPRPQGQIDIDLRAAAVPPRPVVARAGVDPRFAVYREIRDPAIRNALVEDHRWLAVHYARRFAHKGEPLDDLVQVATVGLIKAVERFDPTVGVLFTSYAVPTVVGELQRHFRDTAWSLHVPRQVKELYLSLSEIVEVLTQSLGHSPTVAEIAQHAGASVERTLEALELHGSYRGVPLLPEGDRRDDEALGRDDGGFEAAEARQTVEQLLRTLPTDRDRAIVRLRFIDELSQVEVAARLGISQVHVSRLLRTNLERMRRALARDR